MNQQLASDKNERFQKCTCTTCRDSKEWSAIQNHTLHISNPLPTYARLFSDVRFHTGDTKEYPARTETALKVWQGVGECDTDEDALFFFLGKKKLGLKHLKKKKLADFWESFIM